MIIIDWNVWLMVVVLSCLLRLMDRVVSWKVYIINIMMKIY